MTRPSPEQYATGRRLQLGHPILWSVSQALEAERCTGCLVSVSHGTRHVHAVDGCPAHSEGRSSWGRTS